MRLIQVRRTSATSRIRFVMISGFVAALALAWLPVQSGFAQQQGKTEAAAPKLPPDLDVVPPDALGFVTIRVADLWTSEIAKDLRQRVIRDHAEELEKLEDCGLTLPGIARFTGFVWKPSGEKLVVVTTTKPYSLTKVLGLIG